MKQIHYRPTWAEIDLSAIKFNLGQIRKRIGPRVKILAAVKANAYGHGLVEVSRALTSWGIDYLGVATVDEGIRLRQAGIKVPILNFGSVLEPETGPLVEWNLTQTITSLQTAKYIDRQAGRANRRTKVHLKIDTGMGRLGVRPDEALNLAQEIMSLEHIELEGIYTHFPVAEKRDKKNKKFTIEQIKIFNKVVENLNDSGVNIALRHCANSAAVIDLKTSHFNLVRPGIMLYGAWPSADISVKLKLKPVLSLKTKITYLKIVAPGESISYGRTHIICKKTSIATLPIGYGDGYTRLYSNKAQVLIRGRRAPIVGIICMDQCMVDVGDLKGVRVGDEVVLIGRQGKEQITAEELADLSGTIPYEVLCWISSRVPRHFLTFPTYLNLRQQVRRSEASSDMPC